MEERGGNDDSCGLEGLIEANVVDMLQGKELYSKSMTMKYGWADYDEFYDVYETLFLSYND